MIDFLLYLEEGGYLYLMLFVLFIEAEAVSAYLVEHPLPSNLIYIEKLLRKGNTIPLIFTHVFDSLGLEMLFMLSCSLQTIVFASIMAII